MTLLFNELYSGAPLWLELSGLPLLVREKTKHAAGWAVLRKIVELDCTQHPSAPGTVEVTVVELAARCGVLPEEVRRVLSPLRKMKVLKCFVPDDDEDTALFEIFCPLPVPCSRGTIEDLVMRKTSSSVPLTLRYWDEPTNECSDTVDPLLQEVVDLYLNTCGTRINMFVVDELRLMRQKYPIEAVRKTFNRARQNEIHSLAWIAGQLSRTGKKKPEKNSLSDDKESNDGNDEFVF